MMSWSNGFGWGWLVFLVMAVFCVAMMAGMMRHGMPARVQRASERDENAPERILARRLASGEIDVEEFECLRDALHPATTPATTPSTVHRQSQ